MITLQGCTLQSLQTVCHPLMLSHRKHQHVSQLKTEKYKDAELLYQIYCCKPIIISVDIDINTYTRLMYM